jgi:hypothetical protein
VARREGRGPAGGLDTVSQRAIHRVPAFAAERVWSREGKVTMIRPPRLAILFVVALLARAVTFGNPILHVDEQFYFTVADAMRHGALPYVDIWDRKSLGLFLVYLPAAMFGPHWGIYAYQALALASGVTTAWLVARLADRAGWSRGALVAGLLYIVWIDFVDGQGGQAPVFYNTLVAAAVLLAGPRREPGVPWARGMGAMALIGLALQVKYSCVFEGSWIGLWLLWTAWRNGARIAAVAGYAAVLVAVALVPTLAALGVYAALGHADAFLYANFWSILARRSDPISETIGNLAQVMLCLAPLLAMSVPGLKARPETRDGNAWRWFLGGWLAFSLLGLLMFGSWFNHYALPVIAPAACCSAAFVARGIWGRRIGWALFAVAGVASTWLVATMPAKRGTPGQFAVLVAAVGRGPGCLYVYGNDPMLYPATGRCTVSRYLFPSHLTLAREAGSIGVDQYAEVSRIFDRRPAVVIVPPASPALGEQPAIRALAMARLGQAYRLKAVLPLGHETAAVYVLR